MRRAFPLLIAAAMFVVAYLIPGLAYAQVDDGTTPLWSVPAPPTLHPGAPPTAFVGDDESIGSLPGPQTHFVFVKEAAEAGSLLQMTVGNFPTPLVTNFWTAHHSTEGAFNLSLAMNASLDPGTTGDQMMESSWKWHGVTMRVVTWKRVYPDGHVEPTDAWRKRHEDALVDALGAFPAD